MTKFNVGCHVTYAEESDTSITIPIVDISLTTRRNTCIAMAVHHPWHGAVDTNHDTQPVSLHREGRGLDDILLQKRWDPSGRSMFCLGHVLF